MSSSEIRKIFYSAENISDFYTRKNSEAQAKITVIPKNSVLYVQDEISTGGKTAKKVSFKKISVYLPSSAMDKPKKGDKKALQINVESVSLNFEETKSFWIIDGTKNIFLPETGKKFEFKEGSIKDISVYNECPIYSEFTKSSTSLEKEEINGFSNLVYLDKNNSQYVEILNKKNIFVKLEDSKKCNVCPFEWEKFFHDETKMERGLICDRTSLFTKYDKTGLLKDLYMANAEHDFITEEELHLVYGNKGDFSGAKELREEIRKVVCQHSIEFD